MIASTAHTKASGILPSTKPEMFGGVKMFFYDRETIQEEFGQAGCQKQY